MYVRPTSTRLLRGMLIPAMRAMSLLALTLLVPRVLADHEDRAMAADDLALLAHRLDRRSYLHDPFRLRVTGDAGSGRRRGRPLPGADVRLRGRTAIYISRGVAVARGPETPLRRRRTEPFTRRREGPPRSRCGTSRSRRGPRSRAGSGPPSSRAGRR